MLTRLPTTGSRFMPAGSALPEIKVAGGTDVRVPSAFPRLVDLAYNMWWSWDETGRELWERISPADWARSPNPLTVLQTVAPETWETLEHNDSFNLMYRDVISRFDDYLAEADTWFSQNHSGRLPGGVAYLSTEFGVHDTLPFYSGGLGILAGDHLKASSDLGIPLVGVGLLYRRGFFRQAVDPEGIQQHHYRPLEITRRPLRRVLDRNRQPLVVQVGLPGRTVDVGVWSIDVGRVQLMLLDTDLPSNDPADRPITHILYVRGREMRLCQELVLGVGGVRALEALEMEPSIWHINEGHAAFALLERLSRAVGDGASEDSAIKRVKDNTMFTLHTPVPAGNEVFDKDLVLHYLDGRMPGIDPTTIAELGDSGRDNIFDLGALAIRLSRSTNGVSKKHGEVVSHDWERIIGGPSGAVTNGVHIPTWIGTSMERRYESALGSQWQEQLLTPDAWEAIKSVPDRDLWDAHVAQKDRLLRSVRTRLREQLARHGASPNDLRRVTNVLPSDRLTVVFARRFATYKRAGLLMTDIGRLQWILTNPERPIQLLYCGKAHPADGQGKELIRHIVEMSQSPQLEGHIFMLEDYDIDLARYLVTGADVWLNNPRPPMEASGTSGMKAAANGVLNLSSLDGWWLEGHNGSNGWGFGLDHESDNADAHALYDLLEHEVAPAFYDRTEDGVPERWVSMMKESIATLTPLFSARRMVAEYVDDYYTTG